MYMTYDTCINRHYGSELPKAVTHPEDQVRYITPIRDLFSSSSQRYETSFEVYTWKFT